MEGKTDDLLKFNTTRFGELEVSRSSVVDVMGGVIGFPKFSRYVLLDYNPPFSWLQSLENPGLAFVVVNAAEFGDDYTFTLPYEDEKLALKERADIAIVNVVTVRSEASKTTVNLKAPIVVNLRNMKGRQVILDDARFPTQMLLWAGDDEVEGLGLGEGAAPREDGS